MSDDTKKPTVSKAEQEFNDALMAVESSATDADRAAAAEALDPNRGVGQVTLSAAVAAVIYLRHNKRNRATSFGKVYDFAEAMRRGEWKFHHQGLAAYPDGTLADGQHRVAAVALSGTEQRFMMFPQFDKAAIDVIDRSKSRTAAEALEMMGIQDARAKASVAKVAMEYTSELNTGKRQRFTDPQVEKFVLDHEEMIGRALHIGTNSTQNVSDPCLSATEAARMALLMLMGQWGEQAAVAFIASIQQGVATYPESPTVALSRLFMRAKVSDRNKDRLTTREKLALALKGAQLWSEEKSVARVTWNKSREDLPTHMKPEPATPAAA